MNRLAQRALTLIASVLAATMAPAQETTPAIWAANNLIVPDGPRAGQAFDLTLTPYLVEPLNFFADACPQNKGVVRKSKQTGFTTLAIAAFGYTATCEPCDVFLIEPTSENLADFVGEKLQRALESSPTLARAVYKQTSRSSKGSTTFSKRFRGGSLLMGIATSTADLRGKTRKKVIKDEASDYPHDLGGQGSPHGMIAGAYESFLAGGDWKELNISTPVIKGSCYIDQEFEAGDQRYWHVRCAQCCDPALTCDEIKAVAANAEHPRAALRAIGVFYFDYDLKLFRFNRGYPYEAHYVAPCCGKPIASWERNDLVQAGIGRDGEGVTLGWIPLASAPGKHWSWHFDALSSPFVPWDTIAKRIVDAGDNPSLLKVLYNLTLGRAYEVKGNTPDREALMARRERELLRGHIPPRGLLLTGFADVQMRGIWLEVVAYAPNRESWTVDAQYLEGDTSAHTNAVFDQLRRAALDRDFPDAFGRTRKLDALAVDSGYRAHVVYSFVREWQRLHPDSGADLILATKGMKGWGRPALGMPSLVDIDLDGRKVKEGAKVWPIGTWSLKGSVCSDLFLEIPPLQEGRPPPAAPPGYCHFGKWLDEEYFRQLTAESLRDIIFKGRITGREWVKSGPNHFFDTRVGNAALSEYLGLSSTTPDEWAALARRRGLPAELARVDLFTPRGGMSVEEPVAQIRESVQAAEGQARGAASDGEDDALKGHNLDNWLD